MATQIMSNQAKREHLVETAQRLFSKHGYHGTGIDMILKESGVAKKTLYYHFQSKEELIVEVLRRYDEQFSLMVDSKVKQMADGPRGRLLAIFDVAQEWFSDKNFYGCMFINAIGEYSNTDSSIRDACKGFKERMRQYMECFCIEAGSGQPKELSEQLALLLEGSIVTAQVSQKPNAAEIAKKTAKLLLNESGQR
ncbi:MAG: TetR/AcrR family transcriptional regulator [Candidatus Melainabacteria bacterium]|nr:MAG: TetR/AcrR family transcriptional regulator [Candidatus Melainabacteria bacterium]